MDQLMQISFMSFIIVGLGTMFLIGEILVNTRGVFALLGISFITIFFYSHIPDVSMIIIMFIVYVIGLMLIVIDVKILNDGTLSTLGVVRFSFRYLFSDRYSCRCWIIFSVFKNI